MSRVIYISYMHLIAAILVASLSGAPAYGSDSGVTDDPACSVAAAHISGILTHSRDELLVFSDTRQRVPTGPLSTNWSGTSHLAHSRAALISRLQSLGGESAVSRCARVRSLLEKQNVPYGPNGVASARSGSQGSLATPYSRTIVTVSLPAVNDRGNEAIVIVGITAGPFAGGGWLHHLTKSRAGNWTVSASKPLWLG